MAKSAREMVREADAAVETLPVEQVRALDPDDVVLLDVREPGEWAQGTLPGAVTIPRGLLEFQADPSLPGHNPALDPAKRILVYCASGGRSALAAKTLQEMGYERVAHMAGGYQAWIGQAET